MAGGCKTAYHVKNGLFDTPDGPVLNRTQVSLCGSYYFLVADDLTLNM